MNDAMITREMVSALVKKRYKYAKRPDEWANPIIKINAREHLYATILLTPAQQGRLIRHLCYAALAGAVTEVLSWSFVDGLKCGPLGHQRPRISPMLRRTVLERDGGRCKHCGSDDELELDHIKAWAFGGPTTLANLQVLCGPCNRKKGPTAHARQRSA